MAYDDAFDDNLLKFLRNKNIFGVEDGPFRPAPPTSYPDNDMPMFGMTRTGRAGSIVEDESDTISRMGELYKPESAMTEKYTQALGEMPTRNKPGLLRKIAAGALALGGKPGSFERVLYAPYHRQLEDWKTKISPLAQAAGLERQQNVNLRMLANQMLSQEMGERRLTRQSERDRVLREQGEARIGQGEERLRQGTERLSQGEARLKQADERMKIAREVAKGGQFQVDNSGQAFIVKRDGSTIPVDASYLSFEEKEALRSETAAATTRARESAKRDRIVERIIEDPDNPGNSIRARVNLDTGNIEPLTVKKPGGAPSKAPVSPPKSELEQGRGTVNKAQNIKNSNPKWNKWIKIDKGRVEITRPGIFSGPSEEEYDRIYQSIFGATSQQAPTTAAIAKKPTKPGYMRLIGPNGETGQAPVGTALPSGWRKE